jgi:hypothetical protein
VFAYKDVSSFITIEGELFMWGNLLDSRFAETSI